MVACTMLLAAIENGYQAAIMAPTEILAAQHFNNFVKMLTPLGVNVQLFTSSNPLDISVSPLLFTVFKVPFSFTT